MSETSIRLFISYSHRDEMLRQQLDKHLAPLKGQKVIEAWHDRQIQAGEEWAGQIDENLKHADMILLLISPDFVASNYCYNIELTQAMERHEKGEAIVVPVILEPCDWSWLPFAKLQAFPKDGKAVTTWSNQNEAFLDVVMGVRKKAQALLEQRREGAAQKKASQEQFQKKVEGALADSLISDIERDTLDELRENLGLTAEEAMVIERQAVTPYQEQQKSQSNYRKTLLKLIEKGRYPFSAEIRHELAQRQKDLGLTDKDVQQIEAPLLAEAEARFQALQAGVAAPSPSADTRAEPPVQPAAEADAAPLATTPMDFKFFAELQGHSGWYAAVKTVAISPDGQVIATGSEDYTIKLWDRKTGQEIRTLAGHSGFVQSVTFSPDGKVLASGSNDCTAKLWNWKTGEATHTFSDHTDDVLCVTFSPNGEVLASGSADDTVALWSLTKEEKRTLECSDGVRALAFSSDGDYLVVLCNWEVRLWNLKMGDAVLLKPAEDGGAKYAMALSPDDQTIALGSQDGTVELWDVATKALHRTFSAHEDSVLDGAIESLAFSPDGQVLASAGANNSDKSIKLWKLTTCELLQKLTGHAKGVSAVVFSSDGQTLVSGSYDKTARIWCSSRQ